MMTLKERFYWWSRNMLKFIVGIPFTPIFWLWMFLDQAHVALFVTDGSEVLEWPWEWKIDDD